MSTDNAPDLDGIEARAAKATPGPWAECEFHESYQLVPSEVGVHIPGHAQSYKKPDGTWNTIHVCRGMNGSNKDANAAFIAATRTDVPALIAECRRLRDELAAVRRVARETIVEQSQRAESAEAKCAKAREVLRGIAKTADISLKTKNLSALVRLGFADIFVEATDAAKALALDSAKEGSR